jgi:hypothetical protein
MTILHNALTRVDVIVSVRVRLCRGVVAVCARKNTQNTNKQQEKEKDVVMLCYLHVSTKSSACE